MVLGWVSKDSLLSPDALEFYKYMYVEEGARIRWQEGADESVPAAWLLTSQHDFGDGVKQADGTMAMRPSDECDMSVIEYNWAWREPPAPMTHVKITATFENYQTTDDSNARVYVARGDQELYFKDLPSPSEDEVAEQFTFVGHIFDIKQGDRIRIAVGCINEAQDGSTVTVGVSAKLEIT